VNTAFLILAWTTVGFNVGSGVLSVARLKVIYPLLDQLKDIGVSRSWLVFPIGVLKLAGGLGVAAGLLGVPYLGPVAAAGLILFWTCAIYSHVLARFYPIETVGTFLFLGLAVSTFATGLAV
jgi:hypothetical protein